MSVKTKFKKYLDSINDEPNQTAEFSLLGRKVRITSNPDLVSKIYSDKQVTRANITRRIVEQQGAHHAAVTQEDNKAFIKRQVNKPLLNSKNYKHVADNASNRTLKLFSDFHDTNLDAPIEVYHTLCRSLGYTFIEDLLGVDITTDLEKRIEDTDYFTGTFEEPLTKMVALNYIAFLPIWFKNLFAPKARAKTKSADLIANLIYNEVGADDKQLQILKSSEELGILTHDDVLGEIRAILFSATTLATSLMWSLYLLAKHTEYQQKCMEDQDMSRQVFLESLRLYPPLFMQAYEHKNNSKCPYTRMKRKTVEVISIFNLHRNKEAWNEPDSFDPTRFAVGLSKAKRGSFVPFGGGSRACPGAGLSMNIGPAVLNKLLAEFRFDLVQEPKPKRRLSLLPDGEQLFLGISRM